MHRLLLALTLALLLAGCQARPESTDPDADAAESQATQAVSAPDGGLAVFESAHDFDATYDRLRKAIEGNPNLGTPLMQASRTVAVDLPQKLLVWEEGRTAYVAYNRPAHLEWRHGIEGQGRRLEQIANALNALATAATSE